MPDNFDNIPAIPEELKGFIVEDENASTPITGDSIGSLEELKRELEKEANQGDESTKVNNMEPTADTPNEPADTNPIEPEEVQISYKPLIEAMAEYGVLDLTEGEEVGDTPDDLVSKFETTVNTRINKGIEEYKESIPDLGKQFLDYLEKGGDPRRFIEVQSAPIDFNNLDMDNENVQKTLISEYLRSQEYSTEEINDTIQDYEDSLLLEKQSKLALKKLERLEQDKNSRLMQEQEAIAAAQAEQAEKYVSQVQNYIKGSTEIAGLGINDVEKKQFEDYLFKVDKEGLTQYQKELQNDPQRTQVELAFLKFKKYDFSKVAKKAESNAAAKIRAAILNKNESPARGVPQDVSGGDDFKSFGKILSIK